MKRESSSPRSSHRRSILRSRQESAPVYAADKSAKRRRALQRQPKEALAEVAKKSTQWSSQGRWSSIRAAEGAATKSSRRSSSSSDRSSRTAATKTTWTEGPLQKNENMQARPKIEPERQVQSEAYWVRDQQQREAYCDRHQTAQLSEEQQLYPTRRPTSCTTRSEHFKRSRHLSFTT